MNCPNCGFHNTDNADFCHNCGFRFDNIPQVEPIRIVIPQPQETPQNFSPPPTVVIKQPVKSASNAVLVAFTALVTLLLIGVIALGYIFLSSRQSREVVVATANTNTIIATNVNEAAKPSPTTYEDLKNKIAPPDKSTQLIDEEFQVAAASHRGVPFSVTNSNGARLAGGFRVTKGKPVNFYVYPAEAYEQYPTNGLKPVHLEQTGNKILNERLKAGDYFLVFENNDDQPLTIAAELFLVDQQL
ncbi:MAG: zinc ribbon domain-containing protein [Pyrinomonadaceae bacterium]